MASALERNKAGTRQAKNTAIQRSGQRFSRGSRSAKPASKWTSGLPENITHVENGYGGMGYGPTDPTTKRALDRANPSNLTNEVLEAIAAPKTVRAPGSIWDDPVYGPMANERGAEFAMRARNLDRQINQARQADFIRDESMRTRLDRDAMKLEDMSNQQRMRMYRPESQATGVDPRTGMTVDSGGAFTGEGHDASMMGRGPQTEGEATAQAQQHERVLEGIQAIAKSLSAELGKEWPDEDSKRRVRGLQQQLTELMGVAGIGGGGKGADAPPVEGAKQAPDGNWYVQQGDRWFKVEQ